MKTFAVSHVTPATAATIICNTSTIASSETAKLSITVAVEAMAIASCRLNNAHVNVAQVKESTCAISHKIVDLAINTSSNTRTTRRVDHATRFIMAAVKEMAISLKINPSVNRFVLVE